MNDVRQGKARQSVNRAVAQMGSEVWTQVTHSL